MKLRLIQMFYQDPKGKRNQPYSVMRESAFLADSIVLGLWKETFFDCSKINFSCKESDLCEDVRDIGNNIAMLDVPFSRDYFRMSVEERQKYLAETFRIATKMWCDKKGWDYSLFKAVIDKVEGDNYIVNRNFRVRCRNGDMNAKLVGIQSIDSMDLYVDIYNTESDCNGAGELSEERWNYAFWRQDDTPVIEAEDENEGMKILFDWYRENGINNIGYEDYQSCYDSEMRYIGKGPVGYYELLSEVTVVAEKLQRCGFIKNKFGKSVPIIIHDLEYPWYIIKATKTANPGGEANAFLAAMKALGITD